jgi:hypothetical protein
MDNYWLAEFLVALENKLPQPEQEYADAMLGIVSRHGKLANGDGKGIWVGYVSPEENDNLEIGIKCSNCYFFESNNVCKIVATTIEPNGYCRLAAIPDGIVRKKTDDE